MADGLFDAYLEDLADVAARGDAREESYYPTFKGLLESFAAETGRNEAAVTVLPAHTEAGSPDVRVWDGHQHVTGYIEAKRPGADLEEIEDSEQLHRYRSAFPNLILTDFCRFRLYRDGDCVFRSRLVSPSRLTGTSAPAVDGGDETRELLQLFFGFSVPRSYDAESLATELARRTRFLRDIVLEQLDAELKADEGRLPGFFEAFQEYLIAGLEPLDFADLYAQTLTYGLFAARIRAEGEEFTRRTAAEHIPRSIGVLHEIFEFISYHDVPEALAWIVDDIAEVLAVADASGILDKYYREGKGTDPVVHFYETFLAEYDPEEREHRGVYYTPEAVVGYIVRSLHKILKKQFAKEDGLASSGVTLLDPAAGTMTFVARATREAAEEFADKYGQDAVAGFLTDQILENFYAFELMMAPYAIGHLKMSFVLEELGHRLGEDERFQLYLTNTLEMEELDQTRLPGLRPLAEESHLAGEVKKNAPILVILGNPPYSGHSFNPSWKLVPKRGKDRIVQKSKDGSVIKERKLTFIGNLIEDYKEVDGKPLGERTSKWLQDDYVKFLRFAEWKIARDGKGVVGMITNHSWLENPTFRGMRWHLLQTYDEIHVLDLHGNSLKGETTPEDGRDENVFDIRQGVAISLFIKREGEGTSGQAAVFHQDLWGLRDDKYEWLNGHDVESTKWDEVRPREKFYLFLPRDETALDRYQQFSKLTDIFPVNGVGMTTARDDFVIDFDPDRLIERVARFRASSLPDDGLHEQFGISKKKGWSIREAWKELQAVDPGDLQQFVVPILYRPFDYRWIFYHDSIVWRTAKRVMLNMTDSNLGLVGMRQVSLDEGYTHAFVSTAVLDNRAFRSSKGVAQLFPLYITPGSATPRDLFTEHGGEGITPNLHRRLVPKLREAYGREPTPSAILAYMYAILYAPAYREKYAEFLRIDFPGIPFTSDPELFERLAGLGENLIGLHLLEPDRLGDPVVHFHGEGNKQVVRRASDGFRYDEERKRKYINLNQYFGPIPDELWEYQIGGYQVLYKWLKDRKERRLSTDDIRTFCRIVTAVRRTIDIQEQIDALFLDAEGDIIELHLKA